MRAALQLRRSAKLRLLGILFCALLGGGFSALLSNGSAIWFGTLLGGGFAVLPNILIGILPGGR